jgi:hypothetical protein
VPVAAENGKALVIVPRGIDVAPCGQGGGLMQRLRREIGRDAVDVHEVSGEQLGEYPLSLEGTKAANSNRHRPMVDASNARNSFCLIT